jgi:hypothetical protein
MMLIVGCCKIYNVCGKMAMAKLKSSPSSYIWIVSVPPVSVFNIILKYEAGIVYSVAYSTHFNLVYRESWNCSLLINQN